jgi:hypothetical protein
MRIFPPQRATYVLHDELVLANWRGKHDICHYCRVLQCVKLLLWTSICRILFRVADFIEMQIAQQPTAPAILD